MAAVQASVTQSNPDIPAVCGSLTEQCYCPGPVPWEAAWPQQETPNTNNNLAADNYIRQFEEAYTASYSGLDVKFSCKPSDCSPNKQFLTYHSLSPSYYPQMSPSDKHHHHHHHQQHHEVQQFNILGGEEETNQTAEQSQALYHQTNSYVGPDSVASDYIQPYHIFQVNKDSQQAVLCSCYLSSDGPA